MMKPHFPKQKKSTLAFIATLLLVMFTLPANAQPSLLDPGTQVKFVNPLPIPAKIDVTKGADLRMQMNETTQWLGLTNGVTPLMTKVWGYGPVGKPVTYPGPTFIAKKNIPVNVTWINNLPGHFLPVDASLHMAHPHGLTIPEVANWYAAGNVPTVTHLHGGHTESASDGLPEAWFTQNFRDEGQYFVKRKYTYHNDQEAATLWYHDHALGITRLNVYAGLAGFYLLEDKNERKLTVDGVLPKRKHDIEIVIQDRMFTTDGELYLPSKTGDPWFGDNFGNGFPDPNDNEPLDVGDIDPSVVAEFFGNFIVVNGMTWPYLNVEPRPYRFRLLNGSDSRFYVLEFGPKGSQMNFLQIATDDGLLPNPVQLNQLIIAPGERAEVVVDFSGMEEDPPITLYNYGPDSPYKGSVSINSTPNPHTGKIMQFQVTKTLKVTRGLPIPTVAAVTVLRPPLDPLSPTIYRKLALFEGEDADGRLQPLLGIINGNDAKTASTLNGSLAWFEDITENPTLGAVEEWAVYNATEDAHPVHLHLVAFQIVDRRPFTATVNPQGQVQHDGATGIGGYIVESSIAEDPPELPSPNERGWKDTFIVPPGYVGRVKARFDRPGRYVWHCHILSHEDHEMMRPFHVGPVPIAAAAGLKSESVEDVSIDNLADFRLYPNPISDQGFVQFTLEQLSSVSIKIFDLDGRLVKSDNLGFVQEGSHTHSLSVDQIDNGLYVLELNTGNKLHRERIVISR